MIDGIHRVGDGGTALYLVRHGETDWNAQGRMQGHADIPLNETGMRQAEALAERLAADAEKWTALWTSDLKRALQTAEAIAIRTSLTMHPWKKLRERSLGELEGMPFEEVRRRFPGYLTGEVPMPGIETRAALRRRSMEALGELVRRYPGGRVLVVSHGAFINTALAYISGGRAGTGKTRIHNTSLSVFVWDGQEWQVPVINDVAHLQEEGAGGVGEPSELTGS